jgi:hypothetical protein
MSVEHLNDFAAKLRSVRETYRDHIVPAPRELLVDLLLQAVQEIGELTARVRALESGSPLDVAGREGHRPRRRPQAG